MSVMIAAERVFVDTNVLIYRVDSRDLAKQARAEEWLSRLWASGTGAISWQVLHEYYWTVVRRAFRAHTLAREDVTDLFAWNPVSASVGLVRRAWEWTDTAQLTYWDALILAAAERTGAQYLLSEDFQDGRDYGSVRAINPFGKAATSLLHAD